MRKAHLWRWLYPRWRRVRKETAVKGYTVFLLVPGDLPVFLRIALETCARQRSEGLHEVLVIPDVPGPDFRRAYAKEREKHRSLPLRLVEPSLAESAMLRILRNPHANCWFQFMRGCENTHTPYALWHDSDLFLSDPGFFERHYRACAERRLACLGADRSWDDWYRENGFSHVVSTWELMFEVEWVRRFAPWQHRGHDGAVNGLPHTFDITFLPQCLTPPSRIERSDISGDFIHFNYVVCTYRHFQKSKGSFDDNGFKLLLVRLLADVFDGPAPLCEVPDMTSLAAGIYDPTRRVTYTSSAARENYSVFRTKLEALMVGEWVGGRMDAARRDLAPFDRAFGWTPGAGT